MNIDVFLNDKEKVIVKKRPKIYLAGKTTSSEILRNFRNDNKDKFESTSTWIDLKEDSFIVKNEKGKLWQLCIRDIKEADFLLLFNKAHKDDHCGALVEIGIAMGLRKQIFEVGSSFRTEPCETSDVAFTYHPLYTKLAYDKLDDALDYLIQNTVYWL